MAERPHIPKSVRFEVFKRDSFTCQYCGAKAPDVVLQLEHIKPVAAGGGSEIMNLVTSCTGCNAGKGARELSDDSVIEKQRRQIEELEERRQQLEMMLAWRDGLRDITETTIDTIQERFRGRTNLTLTEVGRQKIRGLLKTFSAAEVLAGIDEAMDTYLRYEGDRPTAESSEHALGKLPGVLNVSRQKATKPYLHRLFYIQGILRKRFRDQRGLYISALEEIHLDGLDVEVMVGLAKRADDWGSFCDECRNHLAR